MAGAKHRMSTGMLWTSLISVTLLIFATASVLVIIVGMLPTLAAYIGDNSKSKNATICVAGMNFTGVFYEVLMLWFGENTFSQALDIVTDVFSLAVMLMSAAVGWLMFMLIPPFVAQFVTIMNQRKIAQLRSQQRKLISEWGQEISVGVGNYGQDGEPGPPQPVAAPTPNVAPKPSSRR